MALTVVDWAFKIASIVGSSLFPSSSGSGSGSDAGSGSGAGSGLGAGSLSGAGSGSSSGSATAFAKSRFTVRRCASSASSASRRRASTSRCAARRRTTAVTNMAARVWRRDRSTRASVRRLRAAPRRVQPRTGSSTAISSNSAATSTSAPRIVARSSLTRCPDRAAYASHARTKRSIASLAAGDSSSGQPIGAPMEAMMQPAFPQC